MTLIPFSRTAALAFAIAVCATAQAPVAPLRTQPTEKLAVQLRFRDWGPVAIAGPLVIAGNATGGGGIYAVDSSTGKLRWSFAPKLDLPAYVNSAPAIAGNLAIAPFPGGAVIAVAVATGKEVWRGPRPALHAQVEAAGGLVYFVGHDGAVYALDAATGQQRWKVEFNPTLAPCHSRPIIANGTVFLTAIGPPAPKDPTKRGGYYLFAFDAATGAERWRFRAEAPYIHNGVCLSQPVLAGGALFATGEHRVFAIDAETGRQRWAPIELRRVQQGRVTELAASKLTAAGGLVIGATPVGLMAIDQAAGSIVWELPGTFNVDRVSLTVAGDVLYFQGSPDAKPAPKDTGTLYALDLSTRQFLWSFTRPTEVEWSFGTIAPFNGGIWVDTYKALLKLE